MSIEELRLSQLNRPWYTTRHAGPQRARSFTVHLVLMDSNRAGLAGGIKVGWAAAYREHAGAAELDTGHRGKD